MSNVAGVVTAAGASRRMGHPKALLRDASGQTLAERQVELLRAGGCEPVVLVAGAAVDPIRAGLPDTMRVVENSGWAKGRLTSVQAGVRHIFAESAGDGGIVLLPVDAVGIRVETIMGLLSRSRTGECEAVRPVCEGKRGHLVWISHALAQRIMAADAPPDLPVYQWLDPFTVEWPVADPAILENVNTPADWAKYSGNDDNH